MEIIFRARAGGKTTEVLNRANNLNGYIVVHSAGEAVRLFDYAQRMGFKINYPITFEAMIHGRLLEKGVKKIHIDNADILIQRLAHGIEIETITITEDKK